MINPLASGSDVPKDDSVACKCLDEMLVCKYNCILSLFRTDSKLLIGNKHNKTTATSYHYIFKHLYERKVEIAREALGNKD